MGDTNKYHLSMSGKIYAYYLRPTEVVSGKIKSEKFAFYDTPDWDWE